MQRSYLYINLRVTLLFNLLLYDIFHKYVHK